MDNPYCSCKPTRVRARRKEETDRAKLAQWVQRTVSLTVEELALTVSNGRAVSGDGRHGLSSNKMALITSDCCAWTVLPMRRP